VRRMAVDHARCRCVRVLASFEHLKESQISVLEFRGRNIAASSREMDSRTLMFEIPDTHWLNLEVVGASKLGSATSGATS
jgi:hypothetical protein